MLLSFKVGITITPQTFRQTEKKTSNNKISAFPATVFYDESD